MLLINFTVVFVVAVLVYNVYEGNKSEEARIAELQDQFVNNPSSPFSAEDHMLDLAWNSSMADVKGHIEKMIARAQRKQNGQLAELQKAVASVKLTTEKQVRDISSLKEQTSGIGQLAEVQKSVAIVMLTVEKLVSDISSLLSVNEKQDVAISSLKERTSDIAAWKKALDRLTVEVERMRLTMDKVVDLERKVWSLTEMDQDLKLKMEVFKQKVEEYMRTRPQRDVLWDAVNSIFEYITRPFRPAKRNLLP